ncbi:MAG: pirin family protein [Crocinitomicaceae bacterium]|nr:pirin family protein [Crocinitomicaceae bacterium]
MGKKESRRSFLQKSTLAGAGALAMSKFGIAAKRYDQNPKEKMIKNITALGFQWQTKDPFLFCVHHEDFYPEANDEMGPKASLEGRDLGQDFMIKDGWRMYHGTKVPGFPGHPHRGFETITVVRKGMVDHTDSLGAAGRYGNGDVQWMTAGKGVQHAEMFPLLDKENPNTLELFQIWLNLPKANKMVDPHFKMMWSESIPNLNVKDENGKNSLVEVIVGEIGDSKAPTPPPNSWANDTKNGVAIWNVQMEAGAKWTLPKASAEVNRTLYFYTGDVLTIGDQELKFYHSADLKPDVELGIQAGEKPCHFLVLQGKPIAEPVVQHGPFVMNTKDEIRQAFIDYQTDRFGGWPWETSGPVHDASRGRFAIHSNGMIDTPEK